MSEQHEPELAEAMATLTTALRTAVDVLSEALAQLERVSRTSGAQTERVEVQADPLLVTVEQAARLLSVSRATVYNMIAAGELASINVRGTRRVETAELNAYIKRSKWSE